MSVMGCERDQVLAREGPCPKLGQAAHRASCPRSNTALFPPLQPGHTTTNMNLNADLIIQLSARHPRADVTYTYGTAGFRTKHV